MCSPFQPISFFFFNDTATTEIYTLSLHDALPISLGAWSLGQGLAALRAGGLGLACRVALAATRDRKSTRLNSSHSQISYAVFCLKKTKHLGTVVETQQARAITDRTARMHCPHLLS